MPRKVRKKKVEELFQLVHNVDEDIAKGGPAMVLAPISTVKSGGKAARSGTINTGMAAALFGQPSALGVRDVTDVEDAEVFGDAEEVDFDVDWIMDMARPEGAKALTPWGGSDDDITDSSASEEEEEDAVPRKPTRKQKLSAEDEFPTHSHSSRRAGVANVSSAAGPSVRGKEEALSDAELKAALKEYEAVGLLQRDDPRSWGAVPTESQEMLEVIGEHFAEKGASNWNPFTQDPKARSAEDAAEHGESGSGSEDDGLVGGSDYADEDGELLKQLLELSGAELPTDAQADGSSSAAAATAPGGHSVRFALPPEHEEGEDSHEPSEGQIEELRRLWASTRRATMQRSALQRVEGTSDDDGDDELRQPPDEPLAVGPTERTNLEDLIPPSERDVRSAPRNPVSIPRSRREKEVRNDLEGADFIRQFELPSDDEEAYDKVLAAHIAACKQMRRRRKVQWADAQIEDDATVAAGAVLPGVPRGPSLLATDGKTKLRVAGGSRDPYLVKLGAVRGVHMASTKWHQELAADLAATEEAARVRTKALLAADPTLGADSGDEREVVTYKARDDRWDIETVQTQRTVGANVPRTLVPTVVRSSRRNVPGNIAISKKTGLPSDRLTKLSKKNIAALETEVEGLPQEQEEQPMELPAVELELLSGLSGTVGAAGEAATASESASTSGDEDAIGGDSDQGDGAVDDYMGPDTWLGRRRDETAVQRKARKKAAQEERRIRRMFKKSVKGAYGEELSIRRAIERDGAVRQQRAAG